MSNLFYLMHTEKANKSHHKNALVYHQNIVNKTWEAVLTPAL